MTHLEVTCLIMGLIVYFSNLTGRQSDLKTVVRIIGMWMLCYGLVSFIMVTFYI